MPDHLLKKKGKLHFTPFEVWVNTKQVHAISKLAILVPEDNLILMELVSATHFSFSLSTLSLSLSFVQPLLSYSPSLHILHRWIMHLLGQVRSSTPFSTEPNTVATFLVNDGLQWSPQWSAMVSIEPESVMVYGFGLWLWVL